MLPLDPSASIVVKRKSVCQSMAHTAQRKTQKIAELERELQVQDRDHRRELKQLPNVGVVKRLLKANKRLMRKNISLKEHKGDSNDIRFKRREFMKALWKRDAEGRDETECNICGKGVGHFDFAAAHITADSDLRYASADRSKLLMSDLPNVCITHSGCNVDEGTVHLFEWLRFLGRDLTPKQLELEAGASAWLTQYLQ